jgi:SWI/SNF-related matrix-associated actin-dependent regulator of chromatin subfamily A-like protein 1
MAASIKKIKEAYDLLENYKGDNPFLVFLKDDVFVHQKYPLNDFHVDYILKNYNYRPQLIDKIVRIADWYAEKKQADWNLSFRPDKICIGYLMGETDTILHCYVKYKRNQDVAKQVFIPRKALLTDIFALDYNKLDINFDKYDNITTKKDPNRKLREHQKSGVKFLLSREKCILADDMGLGKSTTLSVAAIEGGYDRVLIICPASVKSTWKKELMWYVDEDYINIIEGINDKNKAQLEEFLDYPVGKSGKKVVELKIEAKDKGKWKDNKFVIVNYDVLDEFYEIPKSCSKKNVEDAYNNSPMLQFIDKGKTLIIIDEAHRLSNNTSIRYKVIKDLIKRGNPHSVFEATGTPITNRPMNLYNLLVLINHPVTSEWQYYVERYCDGFQIPAKGEKEAWTNRYLSKVGKSEWRLLSDSQKNDLKDYIRSNAKMIWITNGASNLDELSERINSIYLRRLKKDIPGIVNKNIVERFYDLTIYQREEYNRLWDEYEAAQLIKDSDKELNRDLLEGSILRQYISKIMIPHTIKIVDELVDDGEKVVIACAFDEELYTLQEYYGDKCVIYNGKMNAKQKDKAKDDFMSNPKKMVFIGNIDSAGVGLTLTVSKYLIFNNMSFVPSDNEQMMDRIHRLNQTDDVEIIYQIFSDTIYEHIWEVVMKKQYVIDSVIKKEEDKK